METKVNIVEIKRFAVHDGDGIRTTVFFKGCPLRCVWCHNPESISPKGELGFFAHKCTFCGACMRECVLHSVSPTERTHSLKRAECKVCGKCAKACPNDALKVYGKQMTVSEICGILKKDIVFYRQSGGGITLSGGECLLQRDACRKILSEMKSVGISTAVDTCGYVSRDAIDAVMPFTDVFLYDIKAMDPEVHRRCTGHTNELILENIRYIDSVGKAIEVRFPYVPGYNDGEFEKAVCFIKTLSHITAIRILPYHNLAGSKYDAVGMPNTLPEAIPTDKQMQAARDIALSAGLNVKG